MRRYSSVLSPVRWLGVWTAIPECRSRRLKARSLELIGFSIFLASAVPVRAQDLRIIVMSVGQTDSQLLIGPNGRTLLINCGAKVTGSRKEYGYVAARLSEITGRRSVDYFVISLDASIFRKRIFTHDSRQLPQEL
jgi:hypothetical protein